MTNTGLLVRLDAKPGRDQDVEDFLRSAALPLVEEEPGTLAWFAVKFGQGEYGIFDTFTDDAAREAHLAGPVAQALRDLEDELFDTPPRILKLDVIAEKVPPRAVLDTKGMLLTFKPKSGHEPEVEEFLRRARPLVMDEPKTTAWFAIRTDEGDYGIFDVFPDNGARLAHLTGQVPRALAKNAFNLLGSMPEFEMVSVEAEKLA